MDLLRRRRLGGGAATITIISIRPANITSFNMASLPSLETGFATGAVNCCELRHSSSGPGSLAMLLAIRRASSRVSSVAAMSDLPPKADIG